MKTRRSLVAELVRSFRDDQSLTQDSLAKKAGVTRSAVAHLEQSLRIPDPESLERICTSLGIPASIWKQLVDPNSQQRLEFEDILPELTGNSVSTDGLAPESITALEKSINHLFAHTLPNKQSLDLFNSILTNYGVPHIESNFFNHYLSSGAFASMGKFREAIAKFQQDAVRLFTTIPEAFKRLALPECTPRHQRGLRGHPTSKATQTAFTSLLESHHQHYPGHASPRRPSL